MVLENVSADWAVITNPDPIECDTPAPGLSYQVFRFSAPFGAIFGYTRYPVDNQEVKSNVNHKQSKFLIIFFSFLSHLKIFTLKVMKLHLREIAIVDIKMIQ